ncbi:PQQ-binding-like beta-propeller repeat protein [Planctomycetota bacterium]
MKTQRMITNCLLISIFLAITGFYSIAGAADWPNWRGPNYNGISSEKDWDPLKVKDGVQPLWQASVGIGFSTFSVSDGLVYTMGNTGKKGVDESEHADVVYCFDAETGKEIWKHSYPQRLDPKYYEGGTLASPTVSGGKVYTISKDGKAFCLDAKTGQQIWYKTLLEDLGIKRTTWGQAGSPLVIDNIVIYNVGVKGVALNKDDGSVIWENGKTPGGYATAVPFMMDGKKCIVLCGFSEIIGLVAATGEELWRFPWKTENDVNAADPIIMGDMVFISSGYGHGCVLLKIKGNNVTEVWQNKNMRNKMNGSMLWKEYIYGVDEGGELKCLDYKTGELVWAQKGFGQGSLMLADGKLIVMAENGNLVIADATPDGYKVISQAIVLSGKCWSVPVLANGRIYVRNSAGDVVCLDVSADAAVSAEPSCDWPQWHGPNRDAKSTETGLMKKWPEGGPELLWSADGLGTGFSTVSIAGGMIYTTGMIDKEGVLFAFDLKGKLKWQKIYGPEWTRSSPGVRSTPTVNEGNVYVTSGVGVVSSFDAKTGDKNWEVDVLNLFGGEYPYWGIVDSPLIIDNKLICTPGSDKATIVALDKRTGQTIWSSESIGEKSAYCSPILVERGGRKVIVTMLEKTLVGLDAETGKILWSDICGKEDINPATPLYYDGYIYYTSGYDDESVMYELSEDGTQITRKWVNDVLDNHHGGVVLVDGYIYGSNWKGNPRGNWVCLEWETGKVMYETTWIGKGSITFADGMLYCYEEKQGTVALVEPSPESFNIVSSFKVTLGDEEHWGHPVILNGRLYIRHGNTLMAYDIKAQ